MGRKRTELGPVLDAEISIRAARGETAETIFEAIGHAISTPTIRRRLRELKGKTKKPNGQTTATSHLRVDARGTAQPAAVDDVPDSIPEDTPIEDLNKLLKRVEKAIETAEQQKNMGAVSSLAAKASQIMALRHRLAPIPKADPNENPDFVALAAKGEAMLVKLVRELYAGGP